MRPQTKTIAIFALVVLFHAVATTYWYARCPFLSFFLPACLSNPLKTIFPYAGIPFYGFFVGMTIRSGQIILTSMLGIALAFIIGLVHWIAGRIGMFVDFGSAFQSLVIMILSLIYTVPLSIIGGILAKTFRARLK